MDGKLDNDYNGSTNIGKGIKFGKNADGSFFTLRPYLPSNIMQITKNDSTSLFSVDTSGNGTLGDKQIITSGNIGSQSVNYANSAGSANSVAWGDVQSKPYIVEGYAVANSFYRVHSLGKFADSNNILANTSGGNIYWGGNTWSDERLKKNIEASKVNCLDKVNKINLVEFDFIDEKKYGGHHNIGYIAQELKEIIPDAVLEVPADEQDKETYGTETLYTIDDAKMIPYLIKCIQELSAEIELLKNN